MPGRITEIRSSWALFVACVLSTACGAPPEGTHPPEESMRLGQVGQLLHSDRAIPDQYIVVLRDQQETASPEGVSATARSLASKHEGTVLFTYQNVLKGFAVRMPRTRVQALLADPRVAFIEEDGLVEPAGIQASPPWGLDRIDERNLPMDSYFRVINSGSGVNAYVIDSGILMTHTQFGGRAFLGFDATGGNGTDCQGHGTHVAGIIGGTTHGVAKSARLYSVRVLNCAGSGTNAGMLAAVDWVKTNHVKPAVAVMSLTTSSSSTLDAAVASAINAGILFVVAAGNNNANACNYSPARVPAALTVGATTITDARATGSNFGSCLDFFAPGQNIPSAWYSSGTATWTQSGTSMAAAHVAGAAALYLQSHPTATPAMVSAALMADASTGVVSGEGAGSPNRLLYVPPPVVSLISPTGGTVSGTIPVTALTSESVAITQVNFHAGSTLIGSDSSVPYGISWNTLPFGSSTLSLTAQAYNSTTLVGTSSPITINVVCSPNTQLLDNPGFESGSLSWTANPSSVINSLSFLGLPHSGSFKASLGGSNSSLNFISQDVTLPAAFCGAELSFWLKIDSIDPLPNDSLTVMLRDTSGGLLQTLGTYSNLEPGFADYAQVRIPLMGLGAYAGTTVRIQLESHESSLDATSFFIDDTALTLGQ